MAGVTGPSTVLMTPSPTALVFATYTVTATPLVNPVIVHGEAEHRDDASKVPALSTVTSVEVMGVPLGSPSDQLTLSWALPAVSEVIVGAVGTPIGVTAGETGEEKLDPDAFDAVTVKVVETPSMSP